MKKIRNILIILVVAIATILILHSMDIQNIIILGATIINLIIVSLGLKYINWTLKKNNTPFNVLICTLTTMAISGMISFVLWVSIVVNDRGKYIQMVEIADKYLEFAIIISFVVCVMAILMIIGNLIFYIKGWKNGQ